ncbi:hypothetical protein Pgy4_41604, partial [Pseudomonas savastanoi pv. glycinea str. race 4]
RSSDWPPRWFAPDAMNVLEQESDKIGKVMDVIKA